MTKRINAIEMGVNVIVPLFLNPGQEMEEGGPVKAQQLRDLGQNLHDRLAKAAAILETLTRAKWDSQVGLYDIYLTHPDVHTHDQALQEMRALGVNPKDVTIDEWEDILPED
jgi:hypothetical protein